ncbi:MAG: hypothetical protein ACI4R8_01635 [Candidatus Caccovivens sp.]
MIQLSIKEIKNHGEYVLQDKSGKKQSLILEFYNITPPSVDDVLFFHEKILNRSSENFVQPFAFASMTKESQQINDEDIVGLHTKNGNFVLKRVYG